MNFKINKALLPMKGHYFLWNAGTAPIVSFMSVYARQLGLSSFIVGIIYTILPFSGMLAKPLMGSLADKFQCRKLIFLVAQCVAAAAFFAIIFLPPIPQTKSLAQAHFVCDAAEAGFDICLDNLDNYALTNIQNKVKEKDVICKMDCPFKARDWDIACKHWNISSYCQHKTSRITFDARVPLNHSFQMGTCIYFRTPSVTFENAQDVDPFCPLYHQITTNCDVNCDAQAINKMITTTKQVTNVTDYHQFWLLLMVYLIAWIGQAVTVSVADTLCFQLLGHKPHKYGYQRMCGALGWGIFSIISGILVDQFSNADETDKNYVPVFGMGVGMLLLCIVVSYQIQYSHQAVSSSILKDLCRLLTNIRILVFTLWCICMGLCTAMMWNFLFWHLEDLAFKHSYETQSYIKTIEGLVMGIQCLGGELPFFFLSSWILKRIGHVHAMSLVLLVMGVRFMFYSILVNPWWTLPIECLNGLTFGLFYATMASYASIVAPPGTETTTQGMVGAVFEGVGVSLGSFIGGLLLEEIGGSRTFRAFGIFALVACLIHALVQFLIQGSDHFRKDSVARYAAPQDAVLMFTEFDEDLQGS